MNKEYEQRLLYAVEGIRDVLHSMDGKMSAIYAKLSYIERDIK
jgi:hypothetical protein